MPTARGEDVEIRMHHAMQFCIEYARGGREVRTRRPRRLENRPLINGQPIHPHLANQFAANQLLTKFNPTLIN